VASLSSQLIDIHLGDRGTNGSVVHFLDDIDGFRGTTAGTIIGDYTSEDVIANNGAC
jgi:hypothetical protein